jgi:hypothetical protein
LVDTNGHGHFSSKAAENGLAALADAAKLAAERAADSIDDALAFIEASELRLQAQAPLAVGDCAMGEPSVSGQ